MKADAPRTPEELRNLLNRHAGQPVELVVTRNRVSLVSVKFGFLNKPRIRLSEVFLAAPDPVVAALGHYLHSRSRASWRRVCDYVKSQTPHPGVLRLPSLVSRGRVYDLLSIRDRINRQYFNGALSCRISWAKAGMRQRQARSRSLRYGTYNKGLDLVRINPLLDDARVPAEFLDYIVFHEMLHAAVPSSRGPARWRHHHGNFRILERQYPNHAGMQKLARELLHILG